MSLHIKLKRVYEPVEKADGVRILVERLWPRGISKEDAHIAHWTKEIAPSKELRTWYEHDVKKWPHFQEKYEAELKANPEGVAELFQLLKGKTVTFVYAARDELHNSALVLKNYMEHYRP